MSDAAMDHQHPSHTARRWLLLLIPLALLIIAVTAVVAATRSGSDPAPRRIPGRHLEPAWWESLHEDSKPGPPEPGKPATVRFTIPADVSFGTDSADLTGSARAVVRDLGQKLVATAGPVEVAGATDSRGTAEHNLGLSKQRADAVASVLRSTGVKSDRITVVAWGETHPRADETGPDPEQAQALNRRVEVTATVTCTKSATDHATTGALCPD